jgi:predicted RNA binding protein YcfA (HicA-like mRNA interferase family)
MTTRELRRTLRSKGCEEVRQSGSHLIVRCRLCQTVIPVHSGDLPTGLLRRSVRDLTLCLGEGWLQ